MQCHCKSALTGAFLPAYTCCMAEPSLTERYVSRDIEPILVRRTESFSAVALTGPRQTGKSTLLRRVLSDYRYLTLDDPFVRRQAEEDPELLLDSTGTRTIIDEIQYAPSLLPYLKVRIDRERHSKGLYVLTGSQQFHLIRHLGESLAGRIALLELLPFSAAELSGELSGGVGFPNDARELFVRACLQGLYPEPALGDHDQSDAWYASYLQTYLERDIRVVYDIGSLREFDRLLRLLAARCAQPLNMSALATDAGVSVNTVKRWVSILEACRVIYLLPPYYRNLGKRITKSPRVYFTDCGLVCHLTRLRDPDHLLQGPLAGPLFENFCLQEALKAVLNRGIAPAFYYLRTQSGLEVDLLVEGSAGRLTPFEFKLAQTPRAEMADGLRRFAVEFAELKPEAAFVVSLSDRSGPLTANASLLPFGDFCEVVASAA